MSQFAFSFDEPAPTTVSKCPECNNIAEARFIGLSCSRCLNGAGKFVKLISSAVCVAEPLSSPLNRVKTSPEPSAAQIIAPAPVVKPRPPSTTAPTITATAFYVPCINHNDRQAKWRKSVDGSNTDYDLICDECKKWYDEHEMPDTTEPEEPPF